MDRKELRGPDALQRVGVEARHWMEGREKLIVAGVVGVLLIGLGVAITTELSKGGEQKAQKALGAALEPVIRPVSEPGQPPPPPDAPADQKPFASQKEKDEAVVASLTKFRGEHKGTASATTAALPLAQSLYRLGRYDEAIATFRDYLASAPKDEPLRAVALEGQGYALEAKGQLDEALKAYDELAGLEKTEFLDGMGKFHKGRVLILQGKKDEAAKVLSEIPPAFPDSAAARSAQERLNVLASQGVAIPTPPPPAAADGGTGS